MEIRETFFVLPMMSISPSVAVSDLCFEFWKNLEKPNAELRGGHLSKVLSRRVAEKTFNLWENIPLTGLLCETLR